ncbi:MAG: hypothetical protein QFE16_00065 [Pseudomonadota bacterium]|nr:hypothetical protein [Pseudomonadota bacterium]
MVTAPSYDFDPSWQGHDQEARLLVELLRTSRLTVLYCESGANKTAFLQSALMPLLRRRAGDRLVPASARESGVVVPFPDRRKRSAGKASKRKREFVVHFDDWTGDPLSALLSRVQDSAGIAADERAATPQRLSDALDALSGRLDAHFIILLDRFEEFLRTPTDHEGHGRFTNQWVEAIHRPDLPANFLISLDDDARPRLARLRSLIPDLDDFSLKLGRPPGVKTSLAPPDEPEAPAGIAVGAPPILTETVTPLEPAPSVAVVPRASAASTHPPRRPPARSPGRRSSAQRRRGPPSRPKTSTR